MDRAKKENRTKPNAFLALIVFPPENVDLDKRLGGILQSL
jgi:hypothetical protein